MKSILHFINASRKNIQTVINKWKEESAKKDHYGKKWDKSNVSKMLKDAGSKYRDTSEKMISVGRKCCESREQEFP